MKNFLFSVFAFAFVAVSLSCTDGQQHNDYLYQVLSPEQTGLRFSNDLPVDIDLNIFNYMYYYNGGGLAVGDLNNDDLPDLVFSSNIDREAIYLNEGNLKFKDISGAVNVDGGPNSWTTGVVIEDVNSDGLMDIYLCQVGKYRLLDAKNRLFICQGIDDEGVPSYTEQAEQYGLDFQGFSTHAGFFDYDLDGDLDMYLMNHSLHHNGTFGQRSDFVDTYSELSGDRLYENVSGRYVDVTQKCGIQSSVIGYGLGLAFGDINNDGYTDIYVGNDFHENDYLYINQKDGTFLESIESSMAHTSRFSMGVDIADINNDGHQDIISLDMLPSDPRILKMSEGEDALDIFNFKLGYGYNHQYSRNNLQINQGNGRFKEIACYADVYATDWSWSSLFFDANMDGKKDLFISNGIPKRMNDIDYINFISGNDIQYKIQFDQLKTQDLSALEKIPEIKIENRLFLGRDNLQFEDAANQIRNHNVSYSNSTIYSDLDLDGDYDLVTNNINEPAFIYENLSEALSTSIKLAGSENNRSGLGTALKINYDSDTIYHQHFTAKGFQSTMHTDLLVPSEGMKSIEVIWPDHKYQRISVDSIQSVIKLKYQDARQDYVFDESQKKISAASTSDHVGISYRHAENPFIEFNREALIPFSTSSEGPALALGDINADARSDIYIGSSKRHKSRAWKQAEDGSFSEIEVVGLVSDSIYEEIDALFLDVDNDGDQDLVVATGGNEYRLNSPYTNPLLYRSDGNKLIRDTSVFSDIHLTASCVIDIDYDEDGDQDLFFGARAVPRSYGEIPASVLLRNDGDGNFVDVSVEVLPNQGKLGFVLDAVKSHATQSELVLAMEWSPISKLVFNNAKGALSPISKELGWWRHVSTLDMDNDGDLDILAGNLGLNSRLKASEDQPLRMYFADFDDNGVKEQALTYYLDDRDILFSNFMELQKQIPSIKSNFLMAKDFADASVEDILGREKIASADLYVADFLRSCIYLNNGDDGYELVHLPYQAQWSPIHASDTLDINDDGYLDLLVGGNYYGSNVQMGRYDSDFGAVLVNEQGKGFEYQIIDNAPFSAEVKQIRSININGDKHHLIAQNNDSLKVIRLQ